jgi:hypothetical protein
VKRALLNAGYGRPGVPKKVHVELRSKVNLRMFDRRAAKLIGASCGENRFRAEVAEGRFEVVCRATDPPDATIETDPATLAALV